MQSHVFIILIFSLSILGCGTSPSVPTYAESRLQVIAIEKAFAKTMSDRDHEAFSTFIAEDAVFFAGDEPLRGKQQIVSWWARYYTAQDAPFSWEPMDVEILDSGSLAHSSGPVRDPDGKVVGQFNSIWRSDSAGTWRIIYDKGSEVCDCSAQ
ncbi:MAG: nuclear transport factor 2 family protein [Woeseiaceae bacterium]|nr:nuclear transport factor 2 family protein [Woeseiaceae bacterium]